MDPKRWQIIKTILAEASERSRSGRSGWLEEACGGDSRLLLEVEAFLAHEDRLEGFIESPILAATVTEAKGSASAGGHAELQAGQRVGPYRLQRLLAEGGMGAVYLAEREEEFSQRVALKLIRHGLTGPEALRLFHSERQILARLEHPNIARLLDGGTTAEGAPYFAMELVDGQPIDHYCDEHRLTTRQRIELFLPVCAALAAAHQSLVVHRDLKPGNILVDAQGVPKLLDFGIAKLLQPTGGGELAAFTLQRAMTPRYASPEQLRGEPIGTASDIFSLGVVLYQVLTGHLPCGLEDRDPVAAMVAVCEEDPVAPSVVIEREGAIPRADGTFETRTPASVSRVRDGDLRTLKHRLSGDVDAIVAKALRKEPQQRYSSAEALAADLSRHLEGRPVAARQGTFGYRAGKFIRRHRLGVGNAVAVLLLALAFTFALVRQLHETQRSRDRAEEISSFLVELFESASPDRPAGPEPTVRELLDEGRKKLETALGQEPEVRAGLLLRLGEVYSKLGDYDQAHALLTQALALFRQLHPGAHPDLATALGDLAVVDFQTGDPAAASELLRESLEMRRRLGDGQDLIKPMNNLAAILMQRGELDEAETIYRETLALRRALVATAPSDSAARGNLATSLRSLAAAHQAKGELDAAEPLLRESLDLRSELYGPDSPSVATVVLSLGRLAQARGRLEEAQELFARGLDIRIRKLGEDHLHTALARRDLAALELERGNATSARARLERCLHTLRELLPADAPEIVEAEKLLGAAVSAERDLAAEPGPSAAPAPSTEPQGAGG